MSFNKKYLPELPELIKVRESYSSDEEFLEVYFRKVDAVFGSQDSFDYIQKILNMLSTQYYRHWNWKIWMKMIRNQLLIS